MRASVAIAAFLVATGCGPSDSKELDPSIRVDLPRLGFLGDLEPRPAAGEVEPPRAARVLTLRADGRMRLSGSGARADAEGLRDVDFAHVKSELGAWAGAVAGREDDGSCRGSLVLRVDRSVPWRLVQWALITVSDSSVMVYRIFLAGVHEQDGQEGLVAAFLPRDRGCGSPELLPAGARRFKARLRFRGPEVPAVRLYPPLFRAMDPLSPEARAASAVELDADGLVPAGYVIEAMDAALRAGVGSIYFVGASSQALRKGESKAVAEALAVAREASSARGPGIRLDGENLEALLAWDGVLPAVARVRGDVVGSTTFRMGQEDEAVEDVAPGEDDSEK